MKKFLILVPILIFLLSFGLTIFALSVDKTDSTPALPSSISEEDCAILKNKEFYSEELQDFTLNDQPVIKIFDNPFWEYFYPSLNDFLSQDDSASVKYLVIDEQFTMLKQSTQANGETRVFPYQYEPTSYAEDIKAMSAENVILETPCQITAIYGFDGTASHDGASVYVVTDQGTFVKYYENQSADGVWFRKADYRENNIAYFEYLISPENNYDENGNLLYGDSISFLSFVETQGKSELTSNDINDNRIGKTILLISSLIIVSGILLFTVVRIWKKQKEKRLA